MTIQEFQRIDKQISAFCSLTLAKSYANRAVKSMAVLQGDDDRFWVTTLAVAAKLEKAGYEWIA